MTDRADFIKNVLATSLSGKDLITLTAEGASFLASAAAANANYQRDRERFERAACDAEMQAHTISQELTDAKAEIKDLRAQRNRFAASAAIIIAPIAALAIILAA